VTGYLGAAACGQGTAEWLPENLCLCVQEK